MTDMSTTATRNELEKAAQQYAKALFETGQEHGNSQLFKDDMAALSKLFSQTPDLEPFLANHGIPDAEKSSLISHIKTSLSPITSQLLSLMAENGRLAAIPQMVAAYDQLDRKARKITNAEVTVPVEISEALKSRMAATLAQTFGYETVEVKFIVDPNILAGAIVSIAGTRIDGSYQGKLAALSTQVLN